MNCRWNQIIAFFAKTVKPRKDNFADQLELSWNGVALNHPLTDGIFIYFHGFSPAICKSPWPEHGVNRVPNSQAATPMIIRCQENCIICLSDFEDSSQAGPETDDLCDWSKMLGSNDDVDVDGWSDVVVFLVNRFMCYLEPSYAWITGTRRF